MPPRTENCCRWVDQREAFTTFATHSEGTQGQAHIKPLHWYVASRLVVEGGFLPDEITPRPPFRVERNNGWNLAYDEKAATGGERTILGGLKTKSVDVVVTKNGIGPVLAVSCKGAIGAYRNLTNRMEEAAGDCTNLHITYPALVMGFLMVMRAYRADAITAANATPSTEPARVGRVVSQNDIAIQRSGEPVEAIVRYHNALRELTSRRGIRNDVSRYEAVGLALIDPSAAPGTVLDSYPASDSPLRIERFFEALYQRYDERFVYSAPDLKSVTRRAEWAPKSALLDPATHGSLPVSISGLDYAVRLAEQE